MSADTVKYDFVVMITANCLAAGDRILTAPGGLAIEVRSVSSTGKEVAVLLPNGIRPVMFKKTDWVFVLR